jgi:hypothetical protein
LYVELHSAERLELRKSRAASQQYIHELTSVSSRLPLLISDARGGRARFSDFRGGQTPLQGVQNFPCAFGARAKNIGFQSQNTLFLPLCAISARPPSPHASPRASRALPHLPAPSSPLFPLLSSFSSPPLPPKPPAPPAPSRSGGAGPHSQKSGGASPPLPPLLGGAEDALVQCVARAFVWNSTRFDKQCRS